MKKFIAIFTLFLAFSFNATAQEAKTLQVSNSQVKSTKETILENIESLSKTIKIDESLKNDLTNLMYLRQEAVENSKSQEEKQAVFARFTEKMLGAFNEEQIIMLKNNKELFKTLTQLNSK